MSEEESGQVDQLDLVKFPQRIDGSVQIGTMNMSRGLDTKVQVKKKWMVEFFYG